MNQIDETWISTYCLKKNQQILLKNNYILSTYIFEFSPKNNLVSKLAITTITNSNIEINFQLWMHFFTNHTQITEWRNFGFLSNFE